MRPGISWMAAMLCDVVVRRRRRWTHAGVTHFNQPGHSIYHLLLSPLELIHNTRDSVRKAREAHLINKAMTLEPLGINKPKYRANILYLC